jgi:hypothetical protein
VVSSTFPLFLIVDEWARGYACVLKTVAVSAKKLIDSRCVRRFVQGALAAASPTPLRIALTHEPSFLS